MAASTDKVASTCVDSYGSAIGMPQLCGDWMANQIFWLIVTLVIIFLILILAGGGGAAYYYLAMDKGEETSVAGQAAQEKKSQDININSQNEPVKLENPIFINCIVP